MKTKAEWKVERERLDKLISEAVPNFKHTKISGIDTNLVFIEGGKLPAVFDKKTQELRVWGRGSRHSGAKVSVSDLIKLENVLRIWSSEVEGNVD